LVIEWMNVGLSLVDLELQVLAQDLRAIARNFRSINFRHVYREKNSVANSLSKEALALHENILILEEISNGEHVFLREGMLIDF
jgi:hypothetical protein